MNVFLIISIDTECDKSRDWSIRYPLSFRNIEEAVGQRLQPLFDRFGIRPTYLLSPEVLNHDSSVGFFRSLGDRIEVGTHLHGEFVEPQSKFNARAADEFQCDYESDVERMKLFNLTELFKKQFGYSPLGFRAGRFGAGPNTQRFLYELGYRVDSSIYPFQHIATRRYRFNNYYYPVKAHFPVLTGIGGPNTRLLHVPMTVHNRFFQSLPAFFGKPLSGSQKIRAVLKKMLGTERIKTFSLRPSGYSTELLKRVAELHMALHDEGEPVFWNMMFHSNELLAGASPYPQTDSEVQALLDRMSGFFEFALQKARPVPMKEAFTIVKQASTKG